MTPEILYEDNHIIIITKPPGMLSQGDSSGDESMLDILKQYIKKKYKKDGDVFLGLVHRLDKPVSGVMVFARTSKAARRLHTEIINGNMEKYYAAVIEKKLHTDKKWHLLENFLVRENNLTKVTDNVSSNSQKADLYYRVILSSDKYSLIIVKLGTGRKHQIRAQLSAIGAPVAGDKKYGAKSELNNRICLHSVLLAFKHPTLNSKMSFYSDIPEVFNKLIQTDSEKIKNEILELAADFKPTLWHQN